MAFWRFENVCMNEHTFARRDVRSIPGFTLLTPNLPSSKREQSLLSNKILWFFYFTPEMMSFYAHHNPMK